jgi:hypothetical protein
MYVSSEEYSKGYQYSKLSVILEVGENLAQK